MKASEVLRRYANGERDFRGANLRGQNFKGKDLSGANFSEADIRGVNFSNAILRGVNFAGAEAGVPKHWLIGQLMVTFGISVLSGAFSTYPGIVIAALFFKSGLGSQTYAIAEIIILGLMVVTFFAIAYQGLTFRAFLTIATSSVGASVVAGTFAVADSGDFTIARAVAVISTVTVISVITGASAVFVAGNSFCLISIITTFALAFARTKTVANLAALTLTCVFAVSVTVVILSLHVTRRALKRDEKFSLVRIIGVALSAIGGASFCGTDLTEVNFSKAILKSANFNCSKQQQTILTQVCWQNAKKLDSARLGNTYLANPKIRQLVVTLNGRDQNYDGLNLEGVNLQGANLQDASFVGANLNHASLQDANLSRAILKQTQLDGTDLTGATLTGAFIEDWGITGETKLNHVQCDYIFMRVPTRENPLPLRKPDNLREMFADGEFADFIKPYVDTLDLYHSQDVDPRAISIAFKRLSQNHPDADLEIVAMEKRGQSSLNLKVRTAPTANKSELSAEYFDDYNQLKVLSEARLLLLAEKDDRIRNLEQMISTALHQPIFNIDNIQGDFMPEQNQSIHVGRDMNLSGSTLNLGEISGNVSNTINQLQSDHPEAAHLADLLKQLQTAIETEPELSEEDKALALEQTGTLTEVAKNPTNETSKKPAKLALGFLKGVVGALPDTAKLAEACAKLLPLITKLLGI